MALKVSFPLFLQTLGASLILTLFKPAYAFTKIVKTIQTNEGPVDKIIFDGFDPAWYPLELFIAITLIVALYFFIKDFNTIVTPPKEQKQDCFYIKDLQGGNLPKDTGEPKTSISNGMINVRNTDPDFSAIRLINQTDKMYLASVESRTNLNWNGLKFTIPYNLCLKMQKSKIDLSQSTPLAPELIDIQSYNTGAEKAVLKFKSLLNKEENIQENSIYEEVWTFERFKGATSKHSHDMSSCPSCGSKDEPDMDGLCPSCQKNVLTGKFGWTLTQIDSKYSTSTEEYKPQLFLKAADTLERTVMQNKIQLQRDALIKQNPAFNEEKLKEIAAESIMGYYNNLIGDSPVNGGMENICDEFCLRDFYLSRSLLKDERDKFQIADINIIDIKTVRILPDSSFTVITFRVIGQIKLTSKPKTSSKQSDTKTIFSNYVTFASPTGAESWKMYSISKDNTYIP